MERIVLKNIMPTFFNKNENVNSDIWHKEFAFEKGKKYLIESNSGGGKTAILNFIAGLQNNFEGIINIDENNSRNITDNEWANIRRNNIAYMTQENLLIDDITAKENIELKTKITKGKKTKEAINILKRMGMGERINQKTYTLSNGEKQKLNLARTLAQDFDFIMLDEPFSQQDVISANLMTEIIKEEVDKNQAALIVTSVGIHPAIDYDVIIKL